MPKGRGFTPRFDKMCKEIGIQPSIVTDLKSGRKKGLSADVAQKIANYFNVTVAYLLGVETEQKEKPAETGRPPAKGVGRLKRRGGSNPPFSAKNARFSLKYGKSGIFSLLFGVKMFVFSLTHCKKNSFLLSQKCAPVQSIISAIISTISYTCPATL